MVEKANKIATKQRATIGIFATVNNCKKFSKTFTNPTTSFHKL